MGKKKNETSNSHWRLGNSRHYTALNFASELVFKYEKKKNNGVLIYGFCRTESSIQTYVWWTLIVHIIRYKYLVFFKYPNFHFEQDVIT